jgi:hypothetical protein
MIFRGREPIGDVGDSLQQMQNYRGYSFHLERVSSAWRCFVSPTTNDLPILARYCFKHPTKAAALDHAKLRVDKLLAHERLNKAGADSQNLKGENKA